MIKKYLIILIISTNLLAELSDPFSNTKENFKDIELIAIAGSGNKFFAILKTKNQSEIVEIGSVISKDQTSWKIEDINENSVKISNLNSGKIFSLNL